MSRNAPPPSQSGSAAAPRQSSGLLRGLVAPTSGTTATFGGGRTAGGGTGREHPADAHLNAVLRKIRRRYAGADEKVEKLLRRYFNGGKTSGGGRTAGGGAGRIRVGYRTKQDQTGKSFNWLAGLRWAATRAMIAALLYRVAVTRDINDAAPAAYADGANQTAFRLRREIEYYPLPYTEKVVRDLARDHLIDLPDRELDKSKDTAWTEKLLQTIILSSDLRGTDPEEMPAAVARKLVRRCQQANSTAAMAMIYGAFDLGMYRAGLDALAAGVDVEKTWLSILDNRVRDSHRHLHATTLPMGALFHGLHGDLRFPHDPAAPPPETYNCRCRMAIHLKGHAPRASHRGLTRDEVPAYRRWRDQAIDQLGGELALEMEHRRRLHAEH